MLKRTGAIANIVLGLASNLPMIGMMVWGVASGAIPTPGSGPLPPRQRFSFHVDTTSFVSMKSSKNAMYALGSGSGSNDEPQTMPFWLLASTFGLTLLMVYLLLPLIVIVNRAIVTPYKLGYSIRDSYHALFSKYERQKPYILYCAPGLAVSFLLSVACGIGLDLGANLILPNNHSPHDHPWRAAALVAAYALSTLWIVPLAVVVAKTSVQLNLGGVIGYDALVHEDSYGVEIDTTLVAETGTPLVPDMPRASATDEDVVQLRPALPKYHSFVDAIRTIKAEEGVSALYRGWIWTALGLVMAAAAQVVSLGVANQPASG